MKKSSSDFIFRLIKSLTKSEKRYFKIYSNRFTYKDKQKYLDLFDAIDKQKEYDEEALKKKFEGEKFLKHFPTVKTRLKDMVLEGTGQYYVEKNDKLQLQIKIHQVKMLFIKGFYTEALQIIKQVKKSANQLQFHKVLTSAIEWERQIVGNTKGWQAVIEANFHPQILDTIEHSKNEAIYRQLYDTMYALMYESPQNLDIHPQLKKIISHELMSDASKALTIHSKIKYYSILEEYHIYTNNQIKLLYFQKERIVFLEDVERQKKYPSQFLSSLIKYIRTLLQNKNYITASKNIQKLLNYQQNNFIKSNLNAKYYILLHIFHFKSYEYWHTCNYPDLEKLVVEITNNLDSLLQYRNIEAYLNCCYLLVCTNIVLEKYNTALTYSRLYLQQKNTTAHFSITSIKLLEFLVHYELNGSIGNLFLESLVKNSVSFLRRNDLLTEKSKLLFSLFRKLSTIYSQKEISKPIQETLAAFAVVDVDFKKQILSVESIPLTFPWQSWLKSKLQNRPLKEILVEEYEQEKTVSNL